MNHRLASLAALVVMGLLGLARAEDVRLPGNKLILRDTPDAQQLVLVARQGVVAPLPGSTEDPTLVGGELEISNPGTGERARFTTSARDWSVNALGTVFRFQSRVETGPGSEVRTIVVKHKRGLKIVTRTLGITLDEEAQGALSVVMRTGTRRHCFLFGGRIGKDKPGRFVAHKAPAPNACPNPIVGASTTTTSRPPGTRPTTTSVTSSTRPPTPTTSSTTATVNSTSTSSTSTSPSTTTPPTPTTSTSLPSTTSTIRPTTTSTSRPSTTSTIRPTTTSTSRPSTTSTIPPTTTSTSPPTTTTSTSLPPPPTTSTSLPPPTTSTSVPPPTTSSTTSVPTTSTTTTTVRQCGFRGNSCKGECPVLLRCAVVRELGVDLCTCIP